MNSAVTFFRNRKRFTLLLLRAIKFNASINGTVRYIDLNALNCCWRGYAKSISHDPQFLFPIGTMGSGKMGHVLNSLLYHYSRNVYNEKKDNMKAFVSNNQGATYFFSYLGLPGGGRPGFPMPPMIVSLQ